MSRTTASRVWERLGDTRAPNERARESFGRFERRIEALKKGVDARFLSTSRRAQATGASTFAHEKLPRTVAAVRVALRYPRRTLLLQPPSTTAAIRWVGALLAAWKTKES